jgi:hypothetical protein
MLDRKKVVGIVRRLNVYERNLPRPTKQVKPLPLGAVLLYGRLVSQLKIDKKIPITHC